MNIEQLTHRGQVVCVQGRHMLHHMWSTRTGYESMQHGAMVSFDFSNVFPFLTHPFNEVVLRLICLPECNPQFILSTPLAPYHFCVGKGIVREVVFAPRVGFNQGCPFSPVLFSFCVSFVFYPIEQIQRSAPYMYPPPLYKLRPCPSYSRRRDRIPPPPCISYTLVQATVGVGTTLIWDPILIRYQT